MPDYRSITCYIKDKKRIIIYLSPRDGYFEVALVFGEKATQEILKSTVSEEFKIELQIAKAYAEGRGIRIIVINADVIDDLKAVIGIKTENDCPECSPLRELGTDL